MAEGQNTAAIAAALTAALTQIAASPPPVKSGVSTSEFWLSTIFSIGALAAPALVPALGPWGPLAGAAVAAAYAISRGQVKAAATAPAEPTRPAAP